MYKLFITAIAIVTLSLGACKKGKVTGKVIDPFTGKEVAKSKVWLKNTTHTMNSADGKFSFEDVDLGTYTLAAGKNKFSQSAEEFVIDEKNLKISKDIFIYPRQGLNPGLFIPNPAGAEKIKNEWLNYEVECEDKTIAYKETFINKKAKKSFDIPDPASVASQFSALYYHATSTNQDLSAKIIPLKKASTTGRKDCKFKKKDKYAYFADMAKASDLKVSLKSNNLYQIEGSIPKGQQQLALYNDGKLIKVYYVTGK